MSTLAIVIMVATGVSLVALFGLVGWAAARLDEEGEDPATADL